MNTIPSLPPSTDINKSEILYGVENAVGRGVYFMSNVKRRMDIFFDYKAPSIVVDIAEYKDGYIDTLQYQLQWKVLYSQRICQM